MTPPQRTSKRAYIFQGTLLLLAFWCGTRVHEVAPPQAPRAQVVLSSSRPAGTSSSAAASTLAPLRPPRVSGRLRVPIALEASRVHCEPAGASGGPSCAFENLYLREGRLFFAVDGDAAAVAAAAARLPQGVVLSHDMNAAREADRVLPSAVGLAEVRGWLGGGGVPPALSEQPLLLFARLQPQNIYHHYWDDMMFAHSLGCARVAELAARGEGPGGGGEGGGCAPGVPPPYGVVLVDGFGERDFGDWGRIAASEVHLWPLAAPPGAPGGVARVAYLAAGSRGTCTHRRHCSNIIPAAPVALFRRHVQALFGVRSALPPPGAKQTAVLVRRTGRRVLTNYDEIAELLRVMGFEVREAGPFRDVPIREQFLAFANASLAVFVFGAELGPAWVGMPDGSCTAVLHPANIMDTLSYWVADKVGLKVSTIVENFKTGGDPRLAPRPEWAGREKGGLAFEKYSDVWLWLFNQDFRMDPKDLWRAIWCTSAAWPPD